MNHHIELLVIQQSFSKVQHKIDARRSNFLAWLIIALCSASMVNYQRLSLQMGTAAKTESNYRRIQRFMDSACLSMMVVAQMIYQCLGITSGKQVLIWTSYLVVFVKTEKQNRQIGNCLAVLFYTLYSLE